MVRLEKKEIYRPLLLLAYADSAHAAQCGRYFRRHGWEVHLVASATEALRLSAARKPRALVLDAELTDVDGLRTCLSFQQEDPARTVVLLTPDRSPNTLRALAAVESIPVVTRHDPIEMLADTILGKRLAEAI